MILTVLEGKGIVQPCKFVAKILGNTLNVSFHNGAGAFYLADQIISFLETKQSLN